jgi:hypothetical protein
MTVVRGVDDRDEEAMAGDVDGPTAADPLLVADVDVDVKSETLAAALVGSGGSGRRDHAPVSVARLEQTRQQIRTTVRLRSRVPGPCAPICVRSRSMHALVLVLVLAAQAPPPDPAETTEPAKPAQTTATSTSPTAKWGVGLVAVGASVAAAGTVSFTLIEALSTPDRTGNPLSEEAESFTQAAGFTAIALVSVSAVVMVVGTGLILIDEEATAPSSSSPSSSSSPDPVY